MSHILGETPLQPDEKIAADNNKDDIIDVADIVGLASKGNSSSEILREWKDYKTAIFLSIDMAFLF